MPDLSLDSLFVVCLVGALAPLLLGLGPRLRLPAVVLEIVAGILVGPSVLGWVEIDAPVQVLSMIGLSFLLFLSGLEIDVRQLRGRVLRIALLGYLMTLVLGLPIGAGLDVAGWVGSATLLVVILSATSLGLVVPVLKDTGSADGEVGRASIVSASVADISAIVLLSLLFSTSDGSAESRLLLVATFAALVAVTGVVVSHAGRWMRLSDVLLRLQDTTAEIRVRLALVLLIGFTALAQEFGLESILGAFLAGVVISAVDRDSHSHPNFTTKLNAIGFGFLVPVFFVTSGASLQVEGLIESPSALARVPVFLAALLLVRGLPAVLYVRMLGRRPAIAVGLLNAHVAAVHRRRDADRHGAGQPLAYHRCGAGQRRLAVGAAIPPRRAQSAGRGQGQVAAWVTGAQHLVHPHDVAAARLTRRMVRTNLPFVRTYQGVLAALGEQQRLRIVELLAAAPASVGDLAQELPISRPAVSQHLRVLQEQDLVSYHPVGTRNVYRIEASGLATLRDWLDDIWPAAFDSFARYATEQSEE